MVQFDVDVMACHDRQRHLWAALESQAIDLIVVTQGEHVQWLAGPRFGPLFQPAAALRPDGTLLLAAPEKWQGVAAADEVVPYSAKHHPTLRNDQRQVSTAALEAALRRFPAPQRIGVEFSSFARHWNLPQPVALIDIEPTLYSLRRRKDPDELARIRHAIAATGRMYTRAREIIRPGLTELEMFNALQTTAVESLGEMLTGTGNDYQRGSRGGPPRADRAAQAGELFILDTGSRTEEISGLIGNASVLITAINDMVRTRNGIGFVMILTGSVLMIAAYWLTTMSGY